MGERSGDRGCCLLWGDESGGGAGPALVLFTAAPFLDELLRLGSNLGREPGYGRFQLHGCLSSREVESAKGKGAVVMWRSRKYDRRA